MDKEMEAIREAAAKRLHSNYGGWRGQDGTSWDELSKYQRQKWIEDADEYLSLQEGNLKVGVYEVESELPVATLRQSDPRYIDGLQFKIQEDMIKANYRKIVRGINE